MTKTNIAKRIVSIVLAMSIVLSFALVSVSAIPGDYTVVGDVVTQNFEDSSYSPLVKIGAATYELSVEKAYAGSTKSLKVVAGSNGVAKVKIAESIAGIGAHTCYLSFMYYADNAAVNLNALAGQEKGETRSYSVSAPDANGWRKAIFKFTSTNDFTTYHAFGTYGSDVANAVIYIDNLEFAKVDGFTSKTASVPAGATPVVTGIKDFDTDANPAVGDNLMKIKSGSATRVGVTMDKSHWGESSFAYKGNEGNTGSATFFFHPRLLMPVYKDCDDVLPVGTYYFSYYVYSDVAVSTSVVSTAGSLVAPTNATAGQWSKAEGVFEIKEAKVNTGVFDITVNGLGENAVYFDDFILAQITIEGEVALTAEEVVFDYDTMENATVTFTSPIGLKSAEVTAPEGVTVESATVVGDELVVALSGVELGNEYELAVTGVDLFSRAYDVVAAFETPAAETAPMTITSSSIADGAQNVVAPVSYIYINASGEIDSATMAVEDFTITGGASVTAAELVEGTIKVSLANIFPAKTYTLAVDNVANAAGGVLTDSITFTTAATAPKYFYDMEAEEKPELIGAGHGSFPIDFLNKEYAHSGEQAIKLTPLTAHHGGYTGLWVNGLPRNRVYQISFYIKSETWTVSNGNQPTLFDIERGESIVMPTAEAADSNGWVKVTTVFKPTTNDGALMNLRATGEGALWIDDIEVIDVTGTICQPIVKNAAGAFVSEISANATVEIPVVAGTALNGVKVFVVQYDEDGRMVSNVSYTNQTEGAAITFVVPETANKTKVIIMNATTYAPLCDAYTMND